MRPTDERARRERAMTQPIFMIEFHLEDQAVRFDVLGTSKTVYQVTYPSSGALKCTCPDHVIHGNHCKHIFFITERVLQKRFGDHLTWEERRRNIAKRLAHLSARDGNHNGSDVLADQDIVDRYREILSAGDTDVPQHRNPECGVCLTDFTEGEKALHV